MKIDHCTFESIIYFTLLGNTIVTGTCWINPARLLSTTTLVTHPGGENHELANNHPIRNHELAIRITWICTIALVQTDNTFCVIRYYLSPTQWVVGDCPPLKESPGRGTVASQHFQNYWSNLWFIHGNYHYFDTSPVNYESCTYTLFVESSKNWEIIKKIINNQQVIKKCNDPKNGPKLISLRFQHDLGLRVLIGKHKYGRASCKIKQRIRPE